MSLQTTSSQTVGPFFHIGLTWLFTDNLVAAGVAGDPVVLEGAITDGDGQPVIDVPAQVSPESRIAPLVLGHAEPAIALE